MILPDALQRGNRADQPDPEDVGGGTLFCVEDEDFIVEQATGAVGARAWEEYSPAAASGGGAWTLIEARAVVTSPEVFINLGTYGEVLVMLYGVTVSGAGAVRRLRVSVDNGSNYLAGSTDYLQFDANGAKTDKGQLDFDNGNNATAHYIWLHVQCMNLAAPKPVYSGFPTTNLCQMCTTTSVVNAVQVLPHQNALNGGTIYVFGKTF